MNDPVVVGVKSAYERAPASWGSGPARIYRALAAALVAASPIDLAHLLVLDLGAGTGVASHALADAGARAVGADLAEAMMRFDQRTRPPGVVADARVLPFRTASFDGVVAAFSVNHVPRPDRALAEAARVTTPGGVLLASTFPSVRQHPARPLVEQVLADAGYVRPAWFSNFKEELEPALGTPEAFIETARSAGVVDISVRDLDVETGVDDAADIVDWRLGMAQYVEFVASLDPDSYAKVRRAAVAAVSAHPIPVVPALFLTARVPHVVN
ncbi:MAG TPA: class I SAM-dependent methyltransferase [Acidimicrobiales bacterium]